LGRPQVVGGWVSLTSTLLTGVCCVTNGDSTVTVTGTGHNIADGTSVTFARAAAVGGTTPNGTFPISVIDAKTYSYPTVPT
jgi:hypothetical protein